VRGDTTRAREIGDNRAMKLLPLFAAATITALAPAAHADVLKLFAEVAGGGVAGKRLSGDSANSSAALFAEVPHGVYGAQVGAQFLFLDAVIQHHQFTDGSRIATWTQFGAGMRFEVDLGSQEDKQAKRGSYAEIAANVFFGLGTGQQVTPPLSNDEITDKGLLLEGRLGFGKHLSSVFDLGVVIPVSWGYFVKNGGSAAVNDPSTHYQSVQAEVLLVLRGNLRLF
jgi:hypothetical protein